jgi:hypothetical protein
VGGRLRPRLHVRAASEHCVAACGDWGGG